MGGDAARPDLKNHILEYGEAMASAAIAAEREACIAALGKLAKMAKIMGDTSATRALLSAADALSARNQ
jgi:hypothetical protein